MIPTDIHAFLRSRRSIRWFKPDALPDSLLREILTTATFAPSAHNRQPWRFVILNGAVEKSSLAEAMAREFKHDLERDNLPESMITQRLNKSRERITNAPVVILLCMDVSEMDRYSDPQRKNAEYMIAAQSTANAGMQLLLAAHAEGLGGVWICSPMFAREAVQMELNLSKTWEPQAMFLLGYPDHEPEMKKRKPISEVVKVIGSFRME